MNSSYDLFQFIILYIPIFIFSDISVKVPDRIIPAHKIVLAARCNNWSDANLLEICSLGMDVEIILGLNSNTNNS